MEYSFYLLNIINNNAKYLFFNFCVISNFNCFCQFHIYLDFLKNYPN
uniref:Uncharacterized protein n=1 Tax=viral metagenome TaxID=1070528 RepID=A0A6C0DYY3_9ZZZZ